MLSKRIMLLLVALTSCTISSCTNDSEDDLIEISDNKDDPSTNGDLVTYTKNVKAIIDGSCLNCHSDPPKNGAPFALTNYSQVSSRAEGILTAISRTNGSPAAMPPSGKLPQNTIDIISQWIEDGTLE